MNELTGCKENIMNKNSVYPGVGAAVGGLLSLVLVLYDVVEVRNGLVLTVVLLLSGIMVGRAIARRREN